MRHSIIHQRAAFLLPLLAVLAASLFWQTVRADEARQVERNRWSLLAGYGESHPGWGETETRVATVDFVLRRSIPIVENVGDSWYRGRHSLLIELPLHYLPDYDGDFMAGVNFLASYTFTQGRIHPYVFAGGGPVYVGADIPGMGTDLNGNYQLGSGLRFPTGGGSEILLEFRYHHISNGGTSDPNDPLNSAKFLIGYTF